MDIKTIRARQQATIDYLTTAPAVAGHEVTLTPDVEHAAMSHGACICGYRVNVVTAFAWLMIAEHTRIPDAHLNPRNVING